MANAGPNPTSPGREQQKSGARTDPGHSNAEDSAAPTLNSPEVRDIVQKIQTEIRTLVKGEVELAKAELIPSVKNAGMGAGVFIAALYFILNAAILLFIAGALAIWRWLDLPIAVAFVIMAGVLVVLAGILGLIGLVAVKKVKGPQRTVAHGKQTADAVKQAISRGNAAASAPAVDQADQSPAITATAPSGTVRASSDPTAKNT